MGIALLVAAAPGHAQGAKTSAVVDTAATALKPGEFIWEPAMAPTGPMVLVIDLQAQRIAVYRNGVRIGVSSVSTGRPGYLTPTGVFTILQKDAEHRSSTYNNARMPFTERLTWSGIALHAGGLPGYPSSHGCIHLPLTFAKALFSETATGMTVVIAPGTLNPKVISDPGIFAPYTSTGQPDRDTSARLGPDEIFRWQPERAPNGPLTIVVSAFDQRLLVLRDGIIIGRARIDVPPGTISGVHAFDFAGAGADGMPLWRYVALPGQGADAGKPLDLSARRVLIPPAFVTAVRPLLGPGATMVVTGHDVLGGGLGQDLTIVTGT